MLGLDKPIEDLTLIEITFLIGACGVLLTKPDADVTNLVDKMLRLKDRRAELLGVV